MKKPYISTFKLTFVAIPQYRALHPKDINIVYKMAMAI